MSTLWKSTAAALALLTVAAVGGVTVTAASFSDRGVSGGNAVQAGTLPAPINLTAVASGGGTSVALDWDPAPGDFATGWDIFRTTGPCAGWTPSESDIIDSSATTSYTDTTVATGTTYCYAVRGTIEDWDSPLSSPASDTTEVTITRLYTHNAGAGSYQLTETVGSGDQPFGCDVLNVSVLTPLLSACADIGDPDGADSYTFGSTTAYSVYSNAGWVASINLDWAVVLNLAIGGSREIGLQVWYANGGCGSPPGSGSSLIATGTVSFWGFLLQLLNEDNETFQVNLTANPSFTEPVGAQSICLSTTINLSLIDADLLARVDLVNGANSWVEGPFGP